LEGPKLPIDLVEQLLTCLRRPWTFQLQLHIFKLTMSSFPVTPPPGKLPSNFYQEFLDDESNFDDLNYGLNISFKAATIQLAQASLLKLGALAAVHPLESMRILRQVQYGTAVDATEPGGFFDSENEPEASKAAKFSDSGTSNDADDESDYLLQRRSSRNLFEMETREADEYFQKSGLKFISEPFLSTLRDETIEVDKLGYARPSKLETSNSAWPLVFNKKAAIWSSFLLAAKYQGIPSLWQGIMAFWAYQTTFDLTQTILEEVLTSPILWNRSGGLLGYSYQAPNSNDPAELLKTFPYLPVSASIALNASVNFLLTPFDLVRTRLVAQSIYNSEIKCKTLTSALSTIYREEGRLSGLYPNKIFNGITSVLLPALRILPMSLFNHFADAWIESLGIPKGLAYALAQFTFSCTNLAITLPIETIRRRLYLQSIKKPQTSSPRWIYRVPVSPTPYLGFWNCLRRICQEEGVSALYQGWSMQIASSTVLLASNIVLELENEYPDDMESF
jgi:hypothetical protein